MRRQTNIIQGLIVINAAEDLTNKELLLVKVQDGGKQVEALLPTSASDLCLYLLEEGAEADENATMRPLTLGSQLRMVAKGSGSAGALLALADPAAPADKGMVRVIPTAEGSYFSPGIAEEDFVNGQEVLVRVYPRLVPVGAAFTTAAPASTAPTNSSPYGFTQAQATALLATVNELRSAALAHGWKLPNA